MAGPRGVRALDASNLRKRLDLDERLVAAALLAHERARLSPFAKRPLWNAPTYEIRAVVASLEDLLAVVCAVA